MFIVTSPWWLRMWYRNLLWQMPANGNTVYLTFDDGPHPEATPFVLSTLAAFNAKATFFCIGKNVTTHPDIYQQILEQGHTVGNHTQAHTNGFKTNTEKYVQGVIAAAQHINSSWFRPPYGRLTWAQANALRQMNYRIVMWSLLSGDFDTSIDGEQCYNYVQQHLQPGCIVVFHDSAKALPRLRWALPKVLKYIQAMGWQSAAL
ncbi:MAG: polysaccharide deacetylase family protein [Chitinophagaceae bacterium]